MYFSQYGQDKYINDNFFHNKRNGIFLDVGAHDGITLSNSYFFEKQLDWTGICVEALPDVFEQLQVNRHCTCVNGAAWYEDCKKTFRKVIGYAEMLSGIVDTYDAQHVSRINVENQSHQGEYVDIEVQCYDLTKLLLNNNLTKIDFMSIDTEGSEPEILSKLDFDKINIQVLLVENNYNNQALRNMLSNHYNFVNRLQIDDVYVRKN